LRFGAGPEEIQRSGFFQTNPGGGMGGMDF
jgi:hypothetical protein